MPYSRFRFSTPAVHDQEGEGSPVKVESAREGDGSPGNGDGSVAVGHEGGQGGAVGWRDGSGAGMVGLWDGGDTLRWSSGGME